MHFTGLTSLMREAVNDPAKLPSAVPRIQAMIWHADITFPSQQVEELLRDLAYDLDYYVPDRTWRSPQDPSSFGDAKAAAQLALHHGSRQRLPNNQR